MRALSDLEKQCSGISNGVEGDGGAEWSKVTHGIQSLRRVLDETTTTAGTLSQSDREALLLNRLFSILS